MSIRHALLAVVALSIALPAAAQSPRPRSREVSVGSTGSMTSEMARKRRRTMSPYLMNGFGIGAGLITAESKGTLSVTVEMTGFGSATVPGDVDKTNTSEFGVLVGYAMIQRLGPGFMADLFISETKFGRSKYGFFRPTANFAFGGARNFYGFGGVNTMVFSSDMTYEGGPYDGQKLRLQPQPGYQAGVGYVSGNFQGSVQYSMSKIKIDDRLTSPGVIADVKGDFQFSGFEFGVQYRF